MFVGSVTSIKRESQLIREASKKQSAANSASHYYISLSGHLTDKPRLIYIGSWSN